MWKGALREDIKYEKERNMCNEIGTIICSPLLSSLLPPSLSACRLIPVLFDISIVDIYCWMGVRD